MTARGNGALRARLEAEAGAAGVGIGALIADACRKLIADKALDPSAATDDPEAST